ncbi:MAG: hypothetical protein KAJ23_05335 [Maribacter sp.]|nr:hypothetical protein [Maribacter sp.]
MSTRGSLCAINAALFATYGLQLAQPSAASHALINSWRSQKLSWFLLIWLNWHRIFVDTENYSTANTSGIYKIMFGRIDLKIITIKEFQRIFCASGQFLSIHRGL